MCWWWRRKLILKCLLKWLLLYYFSLFTNLYCHRIKGAVEVVNCLDRTRICLLEKWGARDAFFENFFLVVNLKFISRYEKIHSFQYIPGFQHKYCKLFLENRRNFFSKYYNFSPDLKVDKCLKLAKSALVSLCSLLDGLLTHNNLISTDTLYISSVFQKFLFNTLLDSQSVGSYKVHTKLKVTFKMTKTLVDRSECDLLRIFNLLMPLLYFYLL